MNHTEFIKQFIYPELVIDEIACPLNTNNLCSFFVKPTTVLLKDNNILIVGDNRSTETLKNKLILISNIDLNKNTFEISYIEALPIEKIYIFLLTSNVDIASYNCGVSIGVGSSTSKNTIYTSYELLSGYIYPPALSIDNGKISLKLIKDESYEDEYIHLDFDFDLVGRDTINLKLETLPTIKKNKEAYSDYFHGQIKKYQDFYDDYLKKTEAYRIQKEEAAILAEKNRILRLKKLAIQVTLIIVLLIIIGIYLYRNSKSKKNIKKLPKWQKKENIIPIKKSSK